MQSQSQSLVLFATVASALIAYRKGKGSASISNMNVGSIHVRTPPKAALSPMLPTVIGPDGRPGFYAIVVADEGAEKLDLRVFPLYVTNDAASKLVDSMPLKRGLFLIHGEHGSDAKIEAITPMIPEKTRRIRNSD